MRGVRMVIFRFSYLEYKTMTRTQKVLLVLREAYTLFQVEPKVCTITWLLPVALKP